MSNDRDVEDRLGKEFVSKILDHATGGNLEEADLQQIAKQLGELSDGPNSVLGNHKRRMNSSRNVHHRVEMKAILSDFWNDKLYDMSSKEGRDALIEVFKSPDLVGDGNKDLAKKLQELNSGPQSPSTSPAMPGPSGEAVTAENVARAVKTVIMKKSTDPGRIH